MRPSNVNFSGARHNHRYRKLLLPCLLGRPWGLIWFVSIWIMGAAKLHAAPEELAAVAPRELTSMPHEGVEATRVSLHKQLIAAPENLQPDRDTPVRSQPEPAPPQEVAPPSEKPPEPGSASQLKLEGLQVDFRDDLDNYDQHNRFIEPTFRIRLPNGQLIRFKSGYNTFEQRDFDTVTNIPLQAVWEGKVGPVTLQAGGGVDVFNLLPTALNLNFKADAPIFINQTPEGKLDSGLFLSGILEQGPYKFNAQTLENQITAWRFGPNLYWQIDPNTSFFTLYRRGQYNDGNHENQTFSRLERKFGQFFVAANLFTWSYEEDRSQKSGYFSPQDFLVYNGEVGWEGDITNFLRCRVFGNFGQQRLDGTFDNAYSYQGRCTAKISPNVEADFGYGASNVRNRAGDDYNNRSFTGQLRVNF
ncbi:MAG TPA: hypothetical protein DDW76_30010 [Cyanobacteria bacterium UBA11369]|nr:hypothetical protein [Cyanobacteria bacterium UBA11371]HBE33868.1 hypothetical protein [Cyanobacteria bacterium UBA11368]HBE52881.1 hypothetical protein [Cyanobacteria bacterium UBA11369]